MPFKIAEHEFKVKSPVLMLKSCHFSIQIPKKTPYNTIKLVCWVTPIPACLPVALGGPGSLQHSQPGAKNRQAAMYHICLTTAIKAPASKLGEVGER
jgi:hypothetical protein